MSGPIVSLWQRLGRRFNVLKLKKAVRYLRKILRVNTFNTFISTWKTPNRVVLHGQRSKIKAGVPQGSIVRPLFFLVYINDLQEGFTTNAKLFADDTSLFLVVHDSRASSVSLHNNCNDLLKTSQWAYQWKMFNPDTSKQAQVVVFSRKAIKINHATVYLNNVQLSGNTSKNILSDS